MFGLPPFHLNGSVPARSLGLRSTAAVFTYLVFHDHRHLKAAQIAIGLRPGDSRDLDEKTVRNALTKATRTLRNIDWFEVKDIRGAVTKKGEPVFQVEVRIGFRLEGDPV